MASLYITEFADLMRNSWGNTPVSITMEPPMASQVVTIAAGHAESSAFDSATKIVRIHTDAVCSIAFGTAPVATTSHRRLAANQTEYFAVPAGAAYKVSVLANT